MQPALQFAVYYVLNNTADVYTLRIDNELNSRERYS